MGLFRKKKKKKEDNHELFEFHTFKPQSALERHLEKIGITSSRNSSTPVQIEIDNDTDEIKEAVLFGTNRHLLSENHGSDKDLKLSSSQFNVTYPQIIMDVAHNPIEVELMRIQSANTSQVTEVITLNSYDCNGQEVSIPIITQSYFQPTQFQATILDVPFKMTIDGNTQLHMHVRPNTKVIITLFYRRKKDLEKMALIEQLAEIGITPEFINTFIEKKKRKDRRKARIAALKGKLFYILRFKWLLREKKEISESQDDFDISGIGKGKPQELKTKEEKMSPLDKKVKERDYDDYEKGEEELANEGASKAAKDEIIEGDGLGSEVAKATDEVINSPEPDAVDEVPAEDTDLSAAEEKEREDSDEFRSADGSDQESKPEGEDGK